MPIGRRTLVVSTVGITTVLSVLDGTITNVALPTIAQDLNVTSAAVVWVINAFQLAQAVLLVPLSTLGDIIGFARIYRAGVLIFTLASVVCATAHGLPVLVAARTVQGIGAAAILSSSQPISRFCYPAAMLGVSIGVQSLIVSVSSAAGPAIGGLILGIGSWPLLFWINVPFGVVALALSAVLPAMPHAKHRFDWISALLSGATLALFITGLDQLRPPGSPALFAVELIAAIVLGTLLVRRQRGLPVPFLAVDLIGIRIIRLSLIASFTAFLAQSAAFVTLPFFFRALGYTPMETGFLLTPFPVGSACVALIAGWLSDRYHAGVLGSVGLATFGVSMALLALLPAHPETFDIVWRTAIGGLGFGLFVSPNLRAMVGATPLHRSGAISGLTTSTRMSASTTGVALTALIFSLGSGAAAAGTAATTESAIRTVLWVSVALAAAGIAVSALRLEPAGDARREGRAGPWT